MRCDKASASDEMNVNVEGEITSRASWAISAGECQSTMARLGCESDGNESRLSWSNTQGL